MNLTPRERDKLLVAMAAEVARKRLARGVKLNHPEAIALITDAVVEGARDGRSVADLMEAGAHVVTRDQCMEGIAEMIRFSSCWTLRMRIRGPVTFTSVGIGSLSRILIDVSRTVSYLRTQIAWPLPDSM